MTNGRAPKSREIDSLMSTSQIHRIASGSAGQILLPGLVQLAIESPDAFLQQAIESVQSSCQEIQNLAVVRGVKGTWRTRRSTDENFKPPIDLMTECLDSETCQLDSHWMAAPLQIPCTDGRLLVAEVTAQLDPADYDSIAAAFGFGQHNRQATSYRIAITANDSRPSWT